MVSIVSRFCTTMPNEEPEEATDARSPSRDASLRVGLVEFADDTRSFGQGEWQRVEASTGHADGLR